jgi:hypothetical protein
MARATSPQTPQASATHTASTADVVSAAQAINYGVSGLATITNGSAPTIAAYFGLDYSNDGGTTWFSFATQSAGLVASAVYPFPFTFAPGGEGGDWTHYRTRFGGNTGNDVTVAAGATTTTGY